MSKRAMVILNPNAGQEKATDYKKQLNEELSTNYSTVDLRETSGEGDATNWAQEAGEKDYDLVVAVGGDGTVNETINGLALLEDPPLLAIVPMGTVNDLAQALEIPLEAEAAIPLITAGQVKEIDLGQANDHYFTNFLVIGPASQAIHDVPSEEKTKRGPLAYFIEAGKRLTEEDRFDVHISLVEEEWEGEAALVIVALIDSLGGLDSVLTDATIGDGEFLVLVIEKFTLGQLINMTPKMLAGRINDSENVHSFKSTELSIQNLSSKIIPSDLDGEEGPDLPIKFKLFPRKIKVLSNLH